MPNHKLAALVPIDNEERILVLRTSCLYPGNNKNIVGFVTYHISQNVAGYNVYHTPNTITLDDTKIMV